MRVSKLFWVFISCVSLWSGIACAQGVKDPSSPVPSMSFPIRPRDEPSAPTAVPNTSHTRARQPIWLQRNYQYPARGVRRH
jgi:hypothetical protein